MPFPGRLHLVLMLKLARRAASQLDVLSDMNGLKADTAQVNMPDGKTVVVEAKPVEVETHSSRLSLCASLTALAALFILGSITVFRFAAAQPSISDLCWDPTVDSSSSMERRSAFWGATGPPWKRCSVS